MVMQDVIAEQFKSRTILPIAHRINTIADYDRVLVLDAGEIIEDGAPVDLMTDPSSKFALLATAHSDGA